LDSFLTRIRASNLTRCSSEVSLRVRVSRCCGRLASVRLTVCEVVARAVGQVYEWLLPLPAASVNPVALTE